ncbi:hypothetical protein HanIR_Chr10g0456151 [Helianthus annuus]|nr:hypothetical protein HanIR_Chr10g0456151 [Helianthus annuus]
MHWAHSRRIGVAWGLEESRKKSEGLIKGLCSTILTPLFEFIPQNLRYVDKNFFWAFMGATTLFPGIEIGILVGVSYSFCIAYFFL